MPRVSVIIPVYNVASYLPRCLDSVLGQTCRDIEVICVDDCSTDGSRAVLEKYAAQDARLRLLANETNKGAALSRNVGLDVAQGEFVYFIDSDDYIDSDYLERMVSASEHTKSEIVLNLNILCEHPAGATRYVHPTMKAVAEGGEWIDRLRMIQDSQVSIWARLYRRAFLERHALRYLDVKTCNDVVFHYLAHAYCERSFVFSGPAYHYVSRSESITGSAKQKDDRDLCVMRAYTLVYQEYKRRGILNSFPCKMFNVWPYFKVDTEEKFAFYKDYFTVIWDEHYLPFRGLYNDLDRYFAESVHSAKTLDDYKTTYGPIVTVSFIRNRKRTK